MHPHFLPTVQPRKIASFVWRAYIFITATIGTLVLIYPLYLLVLNAFIMPAPMGVYLSSGFMFDTDWKNHTGQVITDKKKKFDNTVIVTGDVKKIMWEGNNVYGMREEFPRQTYFFLCTYGENCRQQQNLTEGELSALLAKKNLPSFDESKARTYWGLLLHDWWIANKRNNRLPDDAPCPNEELTEKKYQICW